MLRLALAEYDRVAPREGEDDELRREWERLAHADELQRAAAEALEAVAGDDEGTTPGAQGLLAAARAALSAVREHDPAAAELADRVAELSYLTTDLGTDLAGYASGVDADPGRLAEVDARRADLHPLLRSHGDLPTAQAGGPSAPAPAWTSWRTTGCRRGCGSRSPRPRPGCDGLAAQVHASRAAAAGRLAAGGDRRAGPAGAGPGAACGWTSAPSSPGRTAPTTSTFLLAAHSGAEPRPLARSASGGELSRVMLAVEVVTTAQRADRDVRLRRGRLRGRR